MFALQHKHKTAALHTTEKHVSDNSQEDTRIFKRCETVS